MTGRLTWSSSEGVTGRLIWSSSEGVNEDLHGAVVKE